MKDSNYYTQSRPEIAKLVPKNISTILDVGCAQGSFLKLVKELSGAETWGIELLPEIAEKATVDKILTGKVEDLIHLIPNGYFDCITFNDVLEHLLEPTEVLKAISLKLSKDGIIIASIPNIRYYVCLYELLIKKDWKYKDSGILDSTHLRFFTKKSMKRMFEEAGFKNIQQKGLVHNSSWKFKLLDFFTFGLPMDIKYQQFICIASVNGFI
ncbi:MAG TPA: class I SAM-dependent methyltransferase [Bacteroidales bacterium]|jgi:2-polyprenyl-3-methyl-5-hydroxy-6-metoxy-1,4-benzoquinol methylase|nr:class I SAM-dependent methyltransferase [Bacteroidales bacterium]